MSDSELIRLWVERKAPRHRRFSSQAANRFRLFFGGKPLSQVTLADVQTFAAAMRARRVSPNFYKDTLLVLMSLFAFGQQTGVLPVRIPLQQWPVKPRRSRKSLSKRLRFNLSWSLCLCLCLFAGRMIPRLWGQNVAEENSPAPEVAAIDSSYRRRQTPVANSKPQAGKTPAAPESLQKSQESAIERERRVKAFLDTIAQAEGTATPDGYRTQYTGAKFTSFQDHPRRIRCGRRRGRRLCSDAAGRYQFLSTTWDRFAKKFGVKDFTPQNQDWMAVELIREKGALGDVEAGRFEPAVRKLAYIWPSFRRFGGSVDSSLPKLEAMYQKNLKVYQQGLAVSN
ncbi:MAG: glycoside hydrolase family 104 protein [Oscillatoriaceae cyanobacterium Prado104]|jgi:muramidase (phage lysozyme)|nr:glycoside hydrolase family 104 protein [Oscillatoriaceae cyanobacterium Prado104]